MKKTNEQANGKLLKGLKQMLLKYCCAGNRLKGKGARMKTKRSIRKILQ